MPRTSPEHKVIKSRLSADEVVYHTSVGNFRARKVYRFQVGRYRWDVWAPSEKRWPVAQSFTLAEVDKLVKLAVKEYGEPTPGRWRVLRELATA